MEDLLSQLYKFIGELGKLGSPIFVYFSLSIFNFEFIVCRFVIRGLNNIIYYKL